MSRELKAKAYGELRVLACDGLLHPNAVVNFAKNPDTALHRYFEWDADKAAERHWLDTAAGLIRTYKVAVRVAGFDAPQQIRAFVSLSTDRANGGGYRSLISVMDDDDMRDTMLADAVRDLEALQRKYGMLSELEAVFVEIEKVVRRRIALKPSEVRASA